MMSVKDSHGASEEPRPGHSSPSRASVVAEHKLLEECCRDPLSVESNLRVALLDALKSQGALAQFEWPAESIVGMSLNTHKSAANGTLAGGYKSLDSYRKAALQSLQDLRKAESRPTRNTIEWYKLQREDTNIETGRLIDEMAVMTQKLEEVMEYARKLAKTANKAQEFLEKQTEFLRKFPARKR